MDLFITVFNANRHWVLPIVLAVVAGFLVREVRIFFLESGLGRTERQPLSIDKVRKAPAVLPFSARGMAPPMPGKRGRASLQFGSAMLFHESRYNGIK